MLQEMSSHVSFSKQMQRFCPSLCEVCGYGIVLKGGHMQTPLRTISHKEAAGIRKTFKIGGLVCIADL